MVDCNKTLVLGVVLPHSFVFLLLFQLDADEMTLENGISKSFDKVIRFHLDPVWHQLVRVFHKN